ncbi:hypothetical protein BASA83_004453 [Batrachochytrium salamandrivorans]|nr:hypothetical protein BASA83_004453 [Batrachochytrium salamandrivorans]
MVQVLTGQPFDTVKVRLQTQSIEAPSYTGVVDCASKTLRRRTPRVLQGRVRADPFKKCITSTLGHRSHEASASSSNKDGAQSLSLPQLYLAGAVSGVANSVLSGPIEHIRTRLQIQSASNKIYNGPLDLVGKVCKAYLMQRTMASHGVKRSQVSSWHQLLFGAASGYMLWIFIYPVDVIKSKIQTDSFDKNPAKYKGMIDCYSKVVAQEGFAGLYRGFWACMLRAGPA